MKPPLVRLEALDHLWFQVTGTLCNLTCRHCFISCGPANRALGLMSEESVRAHLEASRRLGVKEYFFTGGEPFLHPRMAAILEETLRIGPATVLTNATLFKEEALARLARAEAASPYSLEFRVSIDGFNAEQNDPIRGEGTFERAMRGVRQLLDHGFLPIITVMRSWDEAEDAGVFAGFVGSLRGIGYGRPRIKLLPPLRIGREAQRSRGYGEDEVVTEEMMACFDRALLLCSHSRVVTDRGVAVCPILVDAPDACLADTLEESFVPFALRHRACHTCWQNGAICSNPSSNAARLDVGVEDPRS
jgi:MoaA/NifB/PqqE/SkfB family radical SAM enzyme